LSDRGGRGGARKREERKVSYVHQRAVVAEADTHRCFRAPLSAKTYP